MLRSAAIGFALTRDPLERAVSAYYSKMACDTGDAADHAGAIRQLMRQAPRAVSEGLGPGSDLNRSVPCLSAVDCTRALTRERKQIPDWQLTESPAPFLYLAFGRRWVV